MYDLLSQLKISVLDHERKEAKQKYQDALRAYVVQYFGRPLEKLNVRLSLNLELRFKYFHLSIKNYNLFLVFLRRRSGESKYRN